VTSAVHQLSQADLITILTEPRNALVKQFQRFFEFDGIELVFADVSTEEKRVAAVADADYIAVAAEYMPTKAVEAAVRCKVIHKIGEGTDRIDAVKARERGIIVARTAGTNSNSVAEATTMLILATMRRLIEAHNMVVDGRWPKWELRPGNYELKGRQVGIVGLGKIGKVIARHVQAFGARVVYYKRTPLSPEEEAALDARYLPLDELLKSSDVVTLQIPNTPATRGMIGARELALMKPTAILVNTCRGGIVDEEALVGALKEGRIRGAATDVYAKEPVSADNPLLSIKNVVLTPHYTGGSEDCEIEGVKHFYANVVKISRGEPLDPDDYAPAS